MREQLGIRPMVLRGRQIAPVVRPLRTLIRPSVVAIALMLASIALRLPAGPGYHGPPGPHPFNLPGMGVPGGYSHNPPPYFPGQGWRAPPPVFYFFFREPPPPGGFRWDPDV